jgi:hypothetical protein
MRIACDCGKVLRVEEKLLGKRIKCPGCGAVQIVTAESSPIAAGAPRQRAREEDDAPAPPPTKRRPSAAEMQDTPPPRKRRPVPDEGEDEEEAQPPRKRRPVVEDEDEEETPRPGKRRPVEDEEEDRPRKKRKKQAAGVPLWVFLAGGGAALLLLLTAGGVGAYFLFFRKSTDTPTASGPNATQNKEAFTIKFAVLPKVGDVIEFNGSSDKSEKTVWQGLAGKDEDKSLKVKVQGKSKVVNIDTKGRESRTELTFTSFTANKGTGDKQILPANIVVVRELQPGGLLNYQRKDGGALPGEAREVLGDVLGKTTDDDDNDADALFSTTGKKVMGDSWPVNKAVLAKSFNKGAGGLLTVKEENVSGTVKLANVTKEAGVTYLDFDIDISINFNIPAKDIGNGFTMTATGSAIMTGSYRLPADYSTGPVRMTHKMDMKMDMTMQGQGQVLKANMVMLDSKTFKFKYLSGGGKEPGGGKKSRASLPLRPAEGLPRLEVALVDAPVWDERCLAVSRL